MDRIKRRALKEAIFTIMAVSIIGYFSLRSYLLSGDLLIWTVYILINIGGGALAYYRTSFQIKDMQRSEKLTANEYFEMHKRRIKYFILFCIVISIIFVITVNSMFEYSDFGFTLILILVLWLMVIMLVIGWLQGVKKVVKSKDESFDFKNH